VRIRKIVDRVFVLLVIGFGALGIVSAVFPRLHNDLDSSLDSFIYTPDGEFMRTEAAAFPYAID
jgi:hypothetical protein